MFDDPGRDRVVELGEVVEHGRPRGLDRVEDSPAGLGAAGLRHRLLDEDQGRPVAIEERPEPPVLGVDGEVEDLGLDPVELRRVLDPGESARVEVRRASGPGSWTNVVRPRSRATSRNFRPM